MYSFQSECYINKYNETWDHCILAYLTFSRSKKFWCTYRLSKYPDEYRDNKLPQYPDEYQNLKYHGNVQKSCIQTPPRLLITIIREQSQIFSIKLRTSLFPLLTLLWLTL